MIAKILAKIGEYDVEIMFDLENDDSDSFSMVADLINKMNEKAPEIKPRPRFQNNAPKVALPFTGVIDKTELMPAKGGKKEYCLAHVKAPDGEIVPVRYFPPLKTWKAGESVDVQKGQYGPELKEIDENSEIPF